MTALVEYLPCGDVVGRDHKPGCALGPAETIAVEAAAVAAAAGRNQLLAALTALAEAGILVDTPAPGGDPDAMLLGILDELWECGLIVAAAIDRPRLTIVRAEAASPVSDRLEMTFDRSQMLASIETGYRYQYPDDPTERRRPAMRELVAAGWVVAAASRRYELTSAGREALYGPELADVPVIPFPLRTGGAAS